VIESRWNRLLAGLALTAPIPYVAYAQTYLSEDQAASVLFPTLKLTPQWIDLTREQSKTIEKASKERIIFPRLRILWGPNKEALFIDKVVGKHEFITYAVAVGSDGAVQGIEIMDYRETYGDQIREESWRSHFKGKRATDPLTIEKDIPNISGATLSSVHITNGVRRVLKTYELLVKTKA
jgi:hypothetical protein